MKSSFGSVYVVGIRENYFVVAVGVLEGYFNFLVLFFYFEVDYVLVYGFFVSVLVFYKLPDTTFVVIFFFLFLSFSFILQDYLDPFIEECHLSESA